MQTRQVQHVRWEPAAGQLSHFFDDDLVCASVGVHQALVRGIEPFPTKELKPYDAGYVAGWVVERYQIDLVAAAKAARDAMDAKLRQMCAAQIPGDTYRNLDVRANYSGQTFKHILAPIWLLTYDYGAKAFQAVMNGFTGAIQGEYPKSWIKVTLLVVALIVDRAHRALAWHTSLSARPSRRPHACGDSLWRLARPWRRRSPPRCSDAVSRSSASAVRPGPALTGARFRLARFDLADRRRAR